MPRYSFLDQYCAIDQYRTFAFQETYYKSYAVLGWIAQTHVDVVWHQVPFQQIHTMLPAQIAGYSSNSFPEFPVQLLLAKLGYKYNMVFAIPSDVR